MSSVLPTCSLSLPFEETKKGPVLHSESLAYEWILQLRTWLAGFYETTASLRIVFPPLTLAHADTLALLQTINGSTLRFRGTPKNREWVWTLSSTADSNNPNDSVLVLAKLVPSLSYANVTKAKPLISDKDEAMWLGRAADLAKTLRDDRAWDVAKRQLLLDEKTIQLSAQAIGEEDARKNDASLKAVYPCLNCGQHTDLENAWTCYACVKIPLKRCYFCRKAVTFGTRTFVLESKRVATPHTQHHYYAYQKNPWRRETRQRKDVFHSITRWSAPDLWTNERIRVLPSCGPCVLALPKIRYYAASGNGFASEYDPVNTVDRLFFYEQEEKDWSKVVTQVKNQQNVVVTKQKRARESLDDSLNSLKETYKRLTHSEYSEDKFQTWVQERVYYNYTNKIFKKQKEEEEEEGNEWH